MNLAEFEEEMTAAGRALDDDLDKARINYRSRARDALRALLGRPLEDDPVPAEEKGRT